MRCYHKILRISYKDLVINKKVLAKVQQAIRPHKDLLTIVKRCKLQWYGLFSSDLVKTILQGTVKGTDLAKTILHSTVKGGKKTRQMEEEMGRQHQGMDTPGVRQVPEGSEELRRMEELVVKSSVVPRRPSRLRDRWWWWKKSASFFFLYQGGLSSESFTAFGSLWCIIWFTVWSAMIYGIFMVLWKVTTTNLLTPSIWAQLLWFQNTGCVVITKLQKNVICKF